LVRRTHPAENVELLEVEERAMPGHGAAAAKFRLAALLGLAWIILGLTVPVEAEVVNFKELLPFVTIKIPGWTMEGNPCGTTMKQGNMMVSEARIAFKAGDQTLEIVIMDFLGRTLPFLTSEPLQMESSEEIVCATEVQGFKAFATLRHREREGGLNISVADRFWVKLDGEGIDNLEVLTEVAQRMDLKKLATLAK
jgi:hypothetical protein